MHKNKWTDLEERKPDTARTFQGQTRVNRAANSVCALATRSYLHLHIKLCIQNCRPSHQTESINGQVWHFEKDSTSTIYVAAAVAYIFMAKEEH